MFNETIQLPLFKDGLSYLVYFSDGSSAIVNAADNNLADHTRLFNISIVKVEPV